MRVPGWSASLAFALTTLAALGPADGVESEKENLAVRSGEPVLAFDGADLSKFSTFTRFHHEKDPYGVFTVHDGMIHVSGREFGGIATRDSFSDYHLIVEWKWGTRTWHPREYGARNSGVMVHCSGPEGDAFASWMKSIECQIIEGGTGDLIVVPGKTSGAPRLSAEVRVGDDGHAYYQPGGPLQAKRSGAFHWWGRDPGWRDVLGFRGEADVEHPVGQWNRTEIVCDGDSIAYYLNGRLVNAATRSSLTTGKILLQSEGAEIFFRRFEVRPLSK